MVWMPAASARFRPYALGREEMTIATSRVERACGDPVDYGLQVRAAAADEDAQPYGLALLAHR
jgi:hypothetical protein